jgi:hypothetical protein
MLTVGFGFPAADTPEWRQSVSWPISVNELRQFGERAAGAALDWSLGHADPDHGQLARGCVGVALNNFMALTEAAWAAQSAADAGHPVVDGPNDIEFIRTGDRSLLQSHPAMRALPTEPSGLSELLRRSARTAFWTRPNRLFRALVRPDALALSYNSLMMGELRRTGRAVRLARSGHYVANAWSRPAVMDDLASALLDGIERLFDRVPTPLRPEYRARALVALRGRMEPLVGTLRSTFAALRETDVPSRVVSGTHGALATRIVCLEVQRRGGDVENYDHGGQIAQIPDLTGIIDLATTDRFVAPTPLWVNLIEDTTRKISRARRLDVRGGAGDPIFQRACRNGTPAQNPKRVIYVGHPFRGLRSPAIATVPDSIYWDFQSRLVETLLGFKIQLLCKPHPEGAFRGMTNPLARIAPVSRRPFEEHLDDADVFVFDAPTSTTFLETLCTRKIVVLIDRGHYPVKSFAAAEVSRRCRTVPVRYDERGRMDVDEADLKEAVLSPSNGVDPSFFRRLAAGR